MAPQESASYSRHVPAVARAVRTLEVLLGARTPQTLAALSRATGVSPSSLLGILATLRDSHLVTRSPDDGRYALGPGLVALGSAAAFRLGAVQAFQVAADSLVQSLGETALLWIEQGGEYILAAAREGSRPVRYVPQLGVRLDAALVPLERLTTSGDGPETTEGELIADVWMIATPLPSARSGERALLAVAGPRDRLQERSGRSVREALASAVRTASRAIGLAPVGGTWARSGPIEPNELDAFLRQPLVATLSYLSEDGFPATVPLWYAWDGESFWLAAQAEAEWVRHVRRNPRVSLAVSESVPPLRRVLVRGVLEPAVDTGDESQAIEARLAARYPAFTSLTHGAANQPSVLFRLDAHQLIAWRGLVRYPRSPEPAPRKSRRESA